MGEFITRVGAGSRRAHSYPDGPRIGALFMLARNYATGPKVGETVAADPGTILPWNTIDAGTSAWDAGTTYEMGDLVFFNNVEYISRVDNNLNNQPDVSPVQWEVSATVPITPRSTGVLMINAVVVVINNTSDVLNVATIIQVDGSDVSPPLAPGAGIPGLSQVSIPVQAEVEVTHSGQTHYIGIRVQGEGAVIVGDSSTIEVREVIPATG